MSHSNAQEQVTANQMNVFKVSPNVAVCWLREVWCRVQCSASGGRNRTPVAYTGKVRILSYDAMAIPRTQSSVTMYM